MLTTFLVLPPPIFLEFFSENKYSVWINLCLWCLARRWKQIKAFWQNDCKILDQLYSGTVLYKNRFLFNYLMLSALPKLALMLSRPLKRECATVHTSDQMDNWICSELLCDFFVESISVQTHHLYHLIYLNTLNVFKGFSNC